MSKLAIMKQLIGATILAVIISAIPGVAFAHEGSIGLTGSFVSGITHPVLGPDHLLAMLSVGIVSAQIGGRAIWTVPATFVVVMALGGIFGIAVGELEGIEFGIALSVVALGVAILIGKRFPILVAMGFVALFALFHGFAHGVEMPLTAQPVLYAAGFMLATAGIHIAGVFMGDIPQHYEKGNYVLRAGGGFVALIGALFVFRII